MNRSFSINLLFLLLLNAVIKPVWLFGIEVGVQNAVGAGAYGMYYALFNFTFLFNILLDLGINNYQRASVAREGSADLGQLVMLKLLLSLLYVAITSVSAVSVGYPPGYWFFIALLMVNQVLSAYLLLFRATIAGFHRFVRDSILSVTDRFLIILVMGYALVFHREELRMEWFVIAQTGGYVAALVLALLFLPRGVRRQSFRPQLEGFGRVLRETYPYGLLILFMTGYYKLDGVMLERLLPNGEAVAGIYAQAYRLLDAGNNFAFLYAGLLLPMFARLLKDNLPAVNALANQAAILLIAPAGVVACLTFFWGEELMHLLYEQHASTSFHALTWLMGSFALVCVGNVFGTLITASGRLRWLIVLSLATFLLNALLNALLIPSHASTGAAMASFFSLGVMASGQLWLAWRQFGLRSWRWMWQSILLWLAVLALLFGVHEGLSMRWWAELLLGTGLSIGIYGMVFHREIALGIRQVVRGKVAEG